MRWLKLGRIKGKYNIVKNSKNDIIMNLDIVGIIYIIIGLIFVIVIYIVLVGVLLFFV